MARGEQFGNKKKYEEECTRLLALEEEDEMREALRDKYAEQGIDIIPDYSQAGLIKSVRLPFTPKQWLGLLSKGGEFLPTCCGNISIVRDLLLDAVLEDGYIKVEDLMEAAYLLENHDEMDVLSKKEPVYVIVKLHHQLKADYRLPDYPLASDLNEPEDILRVAGDMLCGMNMNDLFNRFERPDRRQYVDEESYQSALKHRREDDYRHQVAHTMFVVRLMPIIKTLHEKLREMDKGPVEGWAIIREDGKVADTVGGPAIFVDQQRCQEVMDLWAKAHLKELEHQDKLRSYKDEHPSDAVVCEAEREEDRRGKRAAYLKPFSIKRVRVTIDKGMEVLP
jgi:hypothetical protein